MKKHILLIILILITLAWFIPVKMENIASYEHKQHMTRADYRQWQHERFLRSAD